MPERIVRKLEARRRIPTGKTKFDQDIAPRLVKVQIGPRCVGFTESSIERLIEDLIAESTTTPRAPLPTDKHQQRGAPMSGKRRRRADAAA